MKLLRLLAGALSSVNILAYRNLIKVPDDRSVLIHNTILINDKDIRLRGSIVLIRPKANKMPCVGVGDGDQTGSRQGDVDFLLILP